MSIGNCTTDVFVSSGAFRTRSAAELIAMAIAAGIGRVELGSGVQWVPDLLESVRWTSQTVQYLVHNYFPPHREPFVLNLAATDEGILERSRSHCRSAVDLAAEMKAPFFSVHAGFAFQGTPEMLGGRVTGAARVPLEDAHRVFVTSVRDLCAYAAPLGVEIFIENNVISVANLVRGRNVVGLCATAEDILRTHADVGADNLRFLVDVGHLKVTANALAFDANRCLDEIGHLVGAFHLSENDGREDQNLPFDERAWFLPRLRDFSHATMVLEAYHLEVDQILENCRVIDRAVSR